MSQMLDVILENGNNVTIHGVDTENNNSFTLQKLLGRGLNQVCIPEGNFKLISTNPTVKLMEPVSINDRKDYGEPVWAKHKVTYSSPELEIEEAAIKQYISATSRSGHLNQTISFVPQTLERNNTSVYFLKIKVTGPIKSMVEIHFGNGTIMNFKGDFTFVSRDKSYLDLLAYIPPDCKLVIQYAQVFKKRESVLKLLNRNQYELNQIQHKVI